MKFRSAFIFVSCFIVSLWSAAPASAITLMDGDFGGLGIDATVFNNIPQLVTTATTPCLTCGVGGGAGLQTKFTAPLGGSAFWTLIDNNLSYNPSTQGAITSLSMSGDKFVSITSLLNDFNLNTGLRVLIKQDGNIYEAFILRSPVTIPAGGGTIPYLTVSGSLLASDFGLLDSTNGNPALTHPDFAGGPMLFGVSATSLAVFDFAGEVDFDNLSVTINEATVTPLPAALPLFATGLGALGLLGWRRRRKAS